MARNRTDKCCFESRYGGCWVTPAQYVVEYLCQLKSETDLPQKFWKLPEWEAFFRWQSKYANKLIKQYGVNVIVAALRDYRLKGLQSLSPKAAWKFKKVFDEYKAKRDVIDSMEPTTTTKAQGDIRRNTQGKMSLFSKLKKVEADNAGEV